MRIPPRRWVLPCLLNFLVIAEMPPWANAEDLSESVQLQSLLSETDKVAEKNDLKHLTLTPGPGVAHERLALGINYTGGQLRWNFSPQWAAEVRYQQGQASSNYGDVKAVVFGLRGYRTSHPASRLPFYWGSEVAVTNAKPETSGYSTNGFAAGAFAGMRYRASRRISLDIDLGPYVISQTETNTHTTATNLDFVLNTALIVGIF